MPTTKAKNTAKKAARKSRPAKRVVKESPLPSVLGKERIRQAVIEVARERMANTTITNKKTVSQFVEN
jgi:hypothetical protein